MFRQNIWQIKSRFTKHALKRRAEVTALVSELRHSDIVLDVGCRDGYITSFFVGQSGFVVGLDLSLDTLKTAKSKLTTSNIDFCRGDANKLPFRSLCFDKVMALQLLEHLPRLDICIEEIDRCAKNNAILTISVPWKEKIPRVKGGIPRWGHLHSFSERGVISLLPNYYTLVARKNLPNAYIDLITSLPILNRLPLKTWLAINDVLGKIKMGYWAIYKFKKLSNNDSEGRQ